MSPSTAPRRPPPADLAFFCDLAPPRGDFRADVLEGLARRPKGLAQKYFYDLEGSRLFEAIRRTPEYYVTRTELSILDRIGPVLRDAVGPGATIVELGSGASFKVRKVLDVLDRPAGFVGIDISGAFLREALRPLARDYPGLTVGGIAADFTSLAHLPEAADPGEGRRLGFLPGSTIGNFSGREAVRLLATIRRLLGPGGALLIGVDLKKDRARLEAAYNDRAGVTAAFNLNLLTRMERELGAELDRGGFGHRAFYDTARGRIEMHIESRRAQTIRIGERVFRFEAGETIHTENSHKYAIEEFGALAEAGGFSRAALWTDAESLFSVHLLTA